MIKELSERAAPFFMCSDIMALTMPDISCVCLRADVSHNRNDSRINDCRGSVRVVLLFCQFHACECDKSDFSSKLVRYIYFVDANGATVFYQF